MADTEEYLLAFAGKQIRARFDKLDEANGEGEDGGSEDNLGPWLYEAERFALWAGNLCLYHQGHSSLDYRLREAETLANFLGRLLEDLRTTLDDFLETSCVNDEPIQELEAIHACGSRLLVESYSGPGSSDGDTSGEDLSEYKDQPQTGMLLSAAVEIIDRLYSLAIQIRNPRTRLISSRVGLIEKFSIIDIVHIKEVFWDFRVVAEQFEGLSQDEKDRRRRPKLLTTEEEKLVFRLAKTNTFRRQQFGYWRRHRDKNATQTFKELEPLAPLVAPSTLPTTTTFLQDYKSIRLEDRTSIVSTQTFVPQVLDLHDEQVHIPAPPSILKKM
ncbi:hypothetical protein MMC17_005241, partial [Xylographa soralifera]|nr:hypothetical protein [Xylographa soralifera]